MKTHIVAIIVHDVEIEQLAEKLGKKYCSPDATELQTFAHVDLRKHILNLEDVEENGGHHALEYEGYIYAIAEYKTIEDVLEELK